MLTLELGFGLCVYLFDKKQTSQLFVNYVNLASLFDSFCELFYFCKTYTVFRNQVLAVKIIQLNNKFGKCLKLIENMRIRKMEISKSK